MRTILLLAAIVLSGCATRGNLEFGAPVATPVQWQIYCAEHPSRPECQ